MPLREHQGLKGTLIVVELSDDCLLRSIKASKAYPLWWSWGSIKASKAYSLWWN